MNASVIKCVFFLFVSFWFGRLAIAGMRTDEVCSFVHPIFGHDSVGCYVRHRESFLYWKRLVFYLSISIAGMIVAYRSLQPPIPKDE